MLRSSREGRKQAARFHAYPTSHFATSPFSPPLLGGAGVKAAGQIGKPLDSHRNSLNARKKAATATATRTSLRQSELIEAETAAADSETETESSFQSSTLVSNRYSIDDDVLSSAERPSSNGSSDADLIEAISCGFEKKERHLENQEKSSSEWTPLGDTMEDVRWQPASSPLSSPLTSQVDEEGQWDDEVDQSGKWDAGAAMDKADAAGKVGGTDESRRELAQRGQTEGSLRYKRLAPRSVEGSSLVSHRSRRTLVKSQKQAEAEESLALSPSSQRRLRRQSTVGPDRWTGGGSRGTAGLDVGLHEGQGQASTSRVVLKVGDALLPNEKGRVVVKEMRIEDVPVPVKRKPGRPRGSTKQAMLERQAREAEMALQAIELEDGRKPEPQKAKQKSVALESSESPSRVLPKRNRGTGAYSDVGEMSSSTESGLTRKISGRWSQMNGATAFVPVSDAPVRDLKPSVLSKRGDRLAAGKGASGTLTASNATDTVVGRAAVVGAEGREKTRRVETALWKKKVFLSSGLYSNDYKSEGSSARGQGSKAGSSQTDSLIRGTSRTRRAQHVSALPLPTDYGRWLLEEKRDFRLPFPISQAIDELREKMQAERKPAPYKHISQNRYFSRAKLPGEILICQCPSDGDCGDSCVNRQTEYLCHPKHCPCGERCTNIYFGKRRAVKTEVHWYGARGFGLRTMEPIAKGGFIDEYRGEVIDFNEAVRRIRDHYKDTGNYYFLMYDSPAGEMLDGGLKGNITRFANHSCDPNCKVQKWLVCGTDEQRAGEFQVALFAERDIAAGEELTYDYGWSAFAAKAVSGGDREECHCAASNCSGFLGMKKTQTGAASLPSKLLKQVKKKRKSRSRASGGRPIAKTAARTATSSSLPAGQVVKAAVGRPRKVPTPAALFTPTKQVHSQAKERMLAGSGNRNSSNVSSPLSSDFEVDSKRASQVMESPVQARVGDVVMEDKRTDELCTPTSTSLDGLSMVPQAQSGEDGKRQYRAGERDTESEAHARKRSRVHDRVVHVLVPRSGDEEKSLILDGKRMRRLSQKAAEEAAETGVLERGEGRRAQASASRESTLASSTSRIPATSPVKSIKPEGILMTTGRFKGTIKDAFHGLRNAGGKAFVIDDYPPGSIFYSRSGTIFDFAEYRKSAMHKKGLKPFVFTRAELHSYVQNQTAKPRGWQHANQGDTPHHQDEEGSTASEYSEALTPAEAMTDSLVDKAC